MSNADKVLGKRLREIIKENEKENDGLTAEERRLKKFTEDKLRIQLEAVFYRMKKEIALFIDFGAEYPGLSTLDYSWNVQNVFFKEGADYLLHPNNPHYSVWKDFRDWCDSNGLEVEVVADNDGHTHSWHVIKVKPDRFTRENSLGD